MSSIFGSVAKVALDEIIRKHSKPSKFGYFLTEEDVQELVGDLLEFLQTSRNLRVGGDNLLKKGLDLDKPQVPMQPTLR